MDSQFNTWVRVTKSGLIAEFTLNGQQRKIKLSAGQEETFFELSARLRDQIACAILDDMEEEPKRS